MDKTMDKDIKIQLELVNQHIKELSKIYKEAIGPYKISENEFWIWYSLLVEDEEYSQNDICNKWSLPKQTVNTIISEMVRNGFVYLHTVPGTRNRKTVYLTDKGRKHGEQIIMPVVMAERRTFGKIPAAEREALISIMEKYIGLMKKETAGIKK